MKKKGPFLRIAIIVVFALTVMIGISTSFAAGNKKPHVTENKNVMILEYDFDEPDVTTEGDFDYVSISGLSRYFKPGTPIIPAKPVEILVPAGMKIANITSVAIDTYQLPDTYRLSHGQKPQRKPSSGEKFIPAPLTQPDPEIFGMTEFWPVEQHDLVTVQTNRGYNIAHVNLFPLQYSPKPGKIKTATKMRLKIHFADADSVRPAKPTKHLREKLGRNIDNPDTMESYDASLDLDEVALRKASPLDSLAGPYQYIVITNASLADYSGANSFQDLCDSKIARGITAGIVTTEWIIANYDGTRPDGGTDNATRIRNFLIDAYQTWGTEYALLAGNKDIIPVRTFNDGTEIPTDVYYGCVDPPECTFDYDGDGIYGENNDSVDTTVGTDGPGGGEVDLTAEIAIGRACVENPTEVANFVNKTLVYGSTSDPYLDYALSGGAWLWANVYTKPFAELIRLGSSLFLGHHTYGFEDSIVPNARDFAVNMTLLYEEDWAWGASDLIAILNGTGGNTTPQMMYISDHGGTYLGMAGKVNIPTLLSLNNTRPFFFYDDSCDVGHFDEPDCFSEVATTMEYGAFACITNSRSGWGEMPGGQGELDSPTTQLTREFFHSVFGEGTFELGRAHADARERCLPRLWYTRYDIYQAILFGDPELQLRVTKPVCAHTCGDQNGVGVNVDLVDFGLFANCWGEDPSTNSDCICANLVEFDDKIINLFDLYVLAELFLTSSLDDPPNCSTSIIDPYPPSPDPTFETAPYATGKASIEMVATKARDVSGWQESQIYEDTGLTPDTLYTYTVKARDLSDNYNETAASAGASGTTDLYDNIVLPANGGVLESFTSEYGGGWVASDLTNGVTDEDGWCSKYNPTSQQEFVYSFRDGDNATLDNAVIHGGTAEGSYYSKNVEVWTSVDGSSYTMMGGDTLLAQANDSVKIDLGDTVARKVKLRITSGYKTDYWELAEFVVNGMVIE